LWTADSPHVAQALAGAEIIVNSSGSHAEIRKAFYQLDLMKTASSKTCTLYAFSNLRGCDGERYYLNGISAIAMNGEFLKVGEHYSLLDVVNILLIKLITHLVDSSLHYVLKRLCKLYKTFSMHLCMQFWLVPLSVCLSLHYCLCIM